MKKILKNSVIILITILLAFAFVQPSFAADVSGITGQITPGGDLNGSEQIYNPVKTIINVIWVLSIVISLITLLIIGIKFIIGGTQEKAKYKESLIPVFVGIFIIVFATTIVNFLYGMK